MLQVQQTHIVSVAQLIGQNQAGVGLFSCPTVLGNKRKKSIFASIRVGLLSLANNLPSDNKLRFVRARAKSQVQESAQNQLKDHSPSTTGSVCKDFQNHYIMLKPRYGKKKKSYKAL